MERLSSLRHSKALRQAAKDREHSKRQALLFGIAQQPRRKSIVPSQPSLPPITLAKVRMPIQCRPTIHPTLRPDSEQCEREATEEYERGKRKFLQEEFSMRGDSVAPQLHVPAPPKDNRVSSLPPIQVCTSRREKPPGLDEYASRMIDDRAAAITARRETTIAADKKRVRLWYDRDYEDASQERAAHLLKVCLERAHDMFVAFNAKHGARLATVRHLEGA